MTPRPLFALLGLGALCAAASHAHAQDPGATAPPALPAAPQPGAHGVQVVHEPPSDRADAWDRFVARHPGAWHAHWNLATGTPQAVFGEGIPLDDWRDNTLDEARRHAHGVLATESELLGLGTSTFREAIGARMGRTWSFTFDQFHASLPVIGGRADVRVSMAGRIAMLGSRALTIPADFATTPALAAETATLAAWHGLGEAPSGQPQAAAAPVPRLVIWADLAATARARPHLAWEVAIRNVAADGSGKAGRSYVDARTGAVLQFVSDKHECGFGCEHASHRAGTHGAEPRANVVAAAATPAPLPINTTVAFFAYTRVGLSGTASAVPAPMIGLQVNVPGFGVLTTDMTGSITVDISASVTVSLNGLDGTHHQTIGGTSAPVANFAILPGLPQTLYLVGSSASSSQLAHSNCAHWIHRVNEWARGIFGNTPELATLDNVAVTVNSTSGTCNAWYSGNTVNFYAAGGGCVNMAFSTVIAHEWGHGLDDRYGGISNNTGDGLGEGWADVVAMYLVDDPDIGENVQGAGSGSLRDGNNGVQYGTQTGVHAAGQSWMGCAWRFRELLAMSMTRAQAKDVSNDVFLGSIVADAESQIAAMLEVFLADDNDGILNNGTPHHTQLSMAATVHALPVPPLGGPANDYCAGAVTIVDGLNGPYSNAGATALTSTWSCAAGTGDADVWFRYVASAAGQLTVSTCGLTTLNTKIQIRSGSCAGTVLACSDDSCGAQTTCSAQVPAGAVYVQVGAASFGTFSMRVWGPGTAEGAAHGTGCGPTPLALTGTAARLGQTLTLTTSPFTMGPIGLQMLGTIGHLNGISLAPLGMPGCSQWSDYLVVHTLVATGSSASYSLAVPNDANLLGFKLKAQSAAMAPGYNALGWITSNGWWMTVGN